MAVSFGNISNLAKEILSLARKVKNNEIVEKVIDLQEQLLDAREENDNLKQEIKILYDKIGLLEKASETENDLIFSQRGFCIKKDAKKRIPYCSHCWTVKHILVPLSQINTKGFWNYKCGSCNIDVVVMDEACREINAQVKGEI